MTLPLTQILPGPTDRAVLVGMTGSGKTTLAREMLKQCPHVVAYDAKGLLNWYGYERYTTLRGAVDSQSTHVIYAPNDVELRTRAYVEAFFEYVYQRGHCAAYIDEVYAVAQGNRLPAYYHALLTRGREKGLATYSSTQRPMAIPNVILSESEHWYVFRLSMPGDRKKTEETVTLTSEQIRALRKREFYYIEAQEQEPRGPLILDLSHDLDGSPNVNELGDNTNAR